MIVNVGDMLERIATRQHVAPAEEVRIERLRLLNQLDIRQHAAFADRNRLAVRDAKRIFVIGWLEAVIDVYGYHVDVRVAGVEIVYRHGPFVIGGRIVVPD